MDNRSTRPGENVSKQGQGWGTKTLSSCRDTIYNTDNYNTRFQRKKGAPGGAFPSDHPLIRTLFSPLSAQTIATTTCVMEVIAYKYLNQGTEADVKSTNYLLPYHLV